MGSVISCHKNAQPKSKIREKVKVEKIEIDVGNDGSKSYVQRVLGLQVSTARTKYPLNILRLITYIMIHR